MVEMSENLGTAVLVNGQVVAWFATFDESAVEWCRDNYFGQWLTWRAKPPEVVPLTEDEELEVQKKVAGFMTFFDNCED